MAACAGVGTAGAVIIVAPGLATAPLLSGIGFTASGIRAGAYHILYHDPFPENQLTNFSAL